MNDKFIKNIIKQHSNIFKLATLETQIEKFEEEKQEYLKAIQMTYNHTKKNDYDKKALEELADCCIVAIGIMRFDKKQGNLCLQEILTYNNVYSHTFFSMGFIKEAIENKMKINKKRKWEVKKGYYKHKGGENE